MDYTKVIAALAIGVGLTICFVALFTHRPRFATMLFVGAALTIGPLSPLTKGPCRTPCG